MLGRFSTNVFWDAAQTVFSREVCEGRFPAFSGHFDNREGAPQPISGGYVVIALGGLIKLSAGMPSPWLSFHIMPSVRGRLPLRIS